MSHGLNPEQQEAVDTLRGPLLVLAGAGSGKTRVVTFRMANLIKHGTQPDRILAVTFTNKAAAEMQHRLSALLKTKSKIKPQVSTFHSHCVRLLRRHARVLGYPEKFAIYDRGDQESLARGVLRDIRVPSDLMRPGDLVTQIGSWKTLGIRPQEAERLASTDKEHLAASGYKKYQKALRHAGAVDFDDLLMLTEELFKIAPQVRQQEARQFDHLLVDEYQDTNGLQYRIIRALADEHRNICVVGDDDQSIYGWRGAEVKHILQFKNDWPDAKVVRLEWNYRSTSAILETANKLIAYNKHRHDKVLKAARAGGERPRIEQYPSEVEEARQVVADIAFRLKDGTRDPRDFAILFRTNEQPRAIETELRKAKLPYVMLGSQSFFDRKEVRDLLAYLRAIESPRDEVSMLRIINTPPRGIGERSVETVLSEAVRSGKTVWDVVSNLSEGPTLFGDAEKTTTLSDKNVAAIRSFSNLIQRYSEATARGDSLAELTRKLISETGYEQEVRRIYPDPEEQQMRLAAVEEVVNSVAAYEAEEEKPSISGYLDQVTLGQREMGDDKEKQLARNAIALMTLHASKGLEFPHVYMIGLEDGILPHSRSVKADSQDQIDEERRLCYVGITRAQERLTLSLALTRMKWGKPRDTTPSRFLFEIIGQADNPHSRGGTRPRSSSR
ncbi:UvrD/REP helicase [Pirellula staleyi DSM 6068]|uniref:DNA 3'-5' helicase n=1 Tax=Pirellula staleyi (strain ATCC 27377 / DSM 6068 / ICPB 4128) TaxID=530564 RepID=D2R6Z4_PIRSD|nr:UvrD-helicase domain-containing protein [Pirellula staleyi]ADB19197.1 UvrD/REP helicase [Pirellula staleyi DSM 6068]